MCIIFVVCICSLVEKNYRKCELLRQVPHYLRNLTVSGVPDGRTEIEYRIIIRKPILLKLSGELVKRTSCELELFALSGFMILGFLGYTARTVGLRKDGC